jgi:hypothetical protein
LRMSCFAAAGLDGAVAGCCEYLRYCHCEWLGSFSLEEHWQCLCCVVWEKLLFRLLERTRYLPGLYEWVSGSDELASAAFEGCRLPKIR